MFVTIRSYHSLKKADYIKYRFERLDLECKILEIENAHDESKSMYSIQAPAEQIEKAVTELLQVQIEYPEENFELNTDPCDLMHILIPIDFSDKSIEACKYALDIAANRPVEVKFLHVWNDELDDFMAVRGSHSIENYKRIQRLELKRDINKNLDSFMKQWHSLIAETNTKKNILYHFSISEGTVKKQIEKVARQCRPNIIIMAHNDHKSHQFRLSREVAGTVIGMGICPVFYLPQKLDYTPLGDLHIMYATNFDKNDVRSFQLLQVLTNGYKTKLYLMHVTGKENLDTGRNKMNKLLTEIESVNTSAAEITGEVITDSTLMKGFTKYTKDNGIDMVSFTSTDHGLWHKLFNPDELKNVMSGSTLPLLIFRHK